MSTVEPENINLNDLSIPLTNEFCFIEDNSAKISRDLRKREKKDFWRDDYLKHVLKFYASNPNADCKNLFSILMYDWHEKDEKSANKYFLVNKFQVYQNSEVSGGITIFEKFSTIIRDIKGSNYFQICMKIVYYFAQEAIDVNCSLSNFVPTIVPKIADFSNDFNIKNEFLKIFSIWLTYSEDEYYDKLKSQFLQVKHSNQRDEATSEDTEDNESSVFELSYTKISRKCDKKFFELAFLLKENLVVNFKIEFKKFVSMHKTYFGEYWTTAIKLNSQLLYIIAVRQDLIDIREFILIELEDPDMKKPITITFQRIAGFQAIFNKALQKDDQNTHDKLSDLIDRFKTTVINETEWTTLITNEPNIKRLFFGRETADDDSIFEKMFQGPYDSDIINKRFPILLNHVWTTFQLKDHPEIWSLKNFKNKRLIEYATEASGHDNIINRQLVSFFCPQSENKINNRGKTLEYMMLKNAIFLDIRINNEEQKEDLSLIHFHLRLIEENQNNDYRNFNSFLYMLEEYSQHSCEDSNYNNDILMKDLLSGIIAEEPEEFDSENELILPRKHMRIGLLMIFLNYFVSKNALYSMSDKSNAICNLGNIFVPFFNLVSMILTESEDTFNDKFAEEYLKMEKSYLQLFKLKSTYKHVSSVEIRHFYEKFSSWFCVILLYAAIKANKMRVVDRLFEFNNFLICIVEFPPNMIVKEIHQYVVQKFLQNKYALSRKCIPRTWISYCVLKEFLDSCIKFQNNLFKIDLRFALPFYNQDESILDEDDRQNFIYLENYDTIKYILDDNHLKPLFAHPVMEIFVRAKYQKYACLFTCHFVAFMILYALPTIAFAHSYHTFGSNWVSFSLVTISTVYISISKCFVNVVKSYSNVPKKMSDIIDTFLFLVSLFILVLTSIDIFGKIIENETFNELLKRVSEVSDVLITTFEVINVILIIIATSYFFPCFKLPIYMKSFKKVLSTLFHVFLIFLPLIICCATLLFIISNENSDSVNVKVLRCTNETESTTEALEEKDDSENKFKFLPESILNYIKIYLTDVSIDTVLPIKWIVSILVIILTVSQTNLLTSVIIDDIGKLMKASEKYNLIVMAEKYTETAKVIKDFKRKNPRQTPQQKSNTNENKNQGNNSESPSKNGCKISLCAIYTWIIKWITFKMYEFFLDSEKNKFAHRLQAIYIDKDTGNCYHDENKSAYEFDLSDSVCIRRVQKGVFSKLFYNFLDNFLGNFIINDEVIEKIRKIIEKDNFEEEND